MSEFDPSPSSDEREREVRRETRDARQRVREVLLSSREPTGPEDALTRVLANVRDRLDDLWADNTD